MISFPYTLFAWADSYRDVLHDRQEDIEEYRSRHNGNDPSFDIVYILKIWLILFCINFILYFLYFLFFDRFGRIIDRNSNTKLKIRYIALFSFYAGVSSIIIPTSFIIFVLYLYHIIRILSKLFNFIKK